jgi:hypothetical protein
VAGGDRGKPPTVQMAGLPTVIDEGIVGWELGTSYLGDPDTGAVWLADGNVVRTGARGWIPTLSEDGPCWASAWAPTRTIGVTSHPTGR